MRVLGIDACLGHCSVAVLEGDSVLAHRSESMARGHVERLAPMVADVLADAGIAPGMLDLIGVTCGPGGFTGARLGAAFARGLALASGCRAVGVSTLEALAFPHRPEGVIVAIDGRRGDLFVQVFGDGDSDSRPEVIAVDELPAFAARHETFRLVGPRDLPRIDPADIARIAATRADAQAPHPLYLRAPDAKVAMRPVLR